MRPLKTTDVFAALRIVTAAGISEEVKMIAKKMDENEKAKKKTNVTDIGVDILIGVLERVVQGPSEKAFYKFISGPLEMSEKEITDMEALDLFDKLAELGEVIDKERWKNFFVRLAGFLQNAK